MAVKKIISESEDPVIVPAVKSASRITADAETKTTIKKAAKKTVKKAPAKKTAAKKSKASEKTQTTNAVIESGTENPVTNVIQADNPASVNETEKMTVPSDVEILTNSNSDADTIKNTTETASLESEVTESYDPMSDALSKIEQTKDNTEIAAMPTNDNNASETALLSAEEKVRQAIALAAKQREEKQKEEKQREEKQKEEKSKSSEISVTASADSPVKDDISIDDSINPDSNSSDLVLNTAQVDDQVSTIKEVKHETGKLSKFKSLFLKKDSDKKEKSGKVKSSGESKKKSESADLTHTTKSPYLNTDDHFHDHLLALVQTNLYLKIITAVCILLTLGTLAFAITIASRSKIVPYVMTVDQHGLAIGTGVARPVTTLDDRIITSQLSRFLINLRTISADVYYFNESVYDVYSMLRQTDPAFGVVSDFFTGEAEGQKGRSRQEIASEELVNVKIISFLKVTPNTVQIDWVETTRSRVNGGAKSKPDTPMRAVITFVQGEAPNSLEGVQRNPFGIYVTNIHWDEVKK